MINVAKKFFFYSIYNCYRFFVELPSVFFSKRNELISNGFCKFFSTDVEKLSNYLDQIIKNPNDAEKSTLGHFKIINKNDIGVKTLAIDPSSKFLHDYVFTDEIMSHIRKFFGKKFYLRNNPTIEYDYKGEKSNVQLFHVDGGLRQLSVMINLTDLDDKKTHMEYLLKTNNQYFFYNAPNRFSEKEQNKIKKISIRSSVEKTTGKKGTVSIFNAGNGYHRQIGLGNRTILHLNFVDNLLHTNWKKDWKPNVDKFPSEKSAYAYYFSWKDNKTYFKENNKVNSEIFSLVNRNLKNRLFSPNIYTNVKNY